VPPGWRTPAIYALAARARGEEEPASNLACKATLVMNEKEKDEDSRIEDCGGELQATAKHRGEG
jgi:hypothetical protein